MVHHQNGDAMPIGNFLQQRQVTVVVGIGVVIFHTSDFLQRVDDDQYRVGMCGEELGQLFLETLVQNVTLGTEVDTGRCFLCDAE